MNLPWDESLEVWEWTSGILLGLQRPQLTGCVSLEQGIVSFQLTLLTPPPGSSMAAVHLLSCTAHPTSASPSHHVRCLVCLRSFAQFLLLVYEDMLTEYLLCTGHCSQRMLMPVILGLLASLLDATHPEVFTCVLE